MISWYTENKYRNSTTLCTELCSFEIFSRESMSTQLLWSPLRYIAETLYKYKAKPDNMQKISIVTPPIFCAPMKL